MQQHNDYGIIILAAGTSGRLGKPKQLLHYKGDTLLNNAIKTASQVQAGELVVVLGAALEEDIKAPVVYNDHFQEGMASSIRCGVQYMQGKVEQVILMVCDQPHLDTAHLLALIAQQKATGAKIVASYYENRKGVPALFHQTLFPELLCLHGDTGAKRIIEKYNAAVVPFPLGAIDIDTEEAYQALITATPGK